MVDSVMNRPRGIVIACSIAICCFVAWILFSPAGWPFYPGENCTWEQWLFARLAIPIAGILASIQFAREESKRLLSADATGFKFSEPFAKTWSFKWDDVSQWGLTRGAWRTTYNEDGTNYENFHPNDETLGITLFGGCHLHLSLPIFGYTQKSNELLAVLRRYAGDRETPIRS
jgi:hypothetical protein